MATLRQAMRMAPIAIVVALLVTWVGYAVLAAEAVPAGVASAEAPRSSGTTLDRSAVAFGGAGAREMPAEYRGIRCADFDYNPVLDPQPNHPN